MNLENGQKAKAQIRAGKKVDATDRAGASCEKHGHPDYSAQKHRINRMIGQLKGIERMIDSRRYCPDILAQTRAVKAAIKGLESTILEEHLRICVRDAFHGKNRNDQEAKIMELLDLFSKASGS